MTSLVSMHPCTASRARYPCSSNTSRPRSLSDSRPCSHASRTSRGLSSPFTSNGALSGQRWTDLSAPLQRLPTISPKEQFPQTAFARRQSHTSRLGLQVTAASAGSASPIEGKTVIITGSNRGIGLEFARQFLAKGNTVIAACRSASDELEELQASAPNGRMTITPLDVSDASSVAQWAIDLKQAGVEHVDVCINNAGVVGMNGYNLWDLDAMSQEEMLFVFTTNTVGPLLVVQQLRRAGLIGPPGTLIANMSSKVGSVDDNGSGKGYAYRASKSALNIINKSMSIDLIEEEITSVLLHPGWVRTDMTQGRGLIDAETSAAGLIEVLEGKHGELNGNWYDYAGKVIPW